MAKNSATSGAVQATTNGETSGPATTRAKSGEAWPMDFVAKYMQAVREQNLTPAQFCEAYHHTKSAAAVPSLHQTVGGLNAALREKGLPTLGKLKRATKAGGGRAAQAIAAIEAAQAAAQAAAPTEA